MREKEREKERRKTDHVLVVFQNQGDRLVSPKDAELRTGQEAGRGGQLINDEGSVLKKKVENIE